MSCNPRRRIMSSLGRKLAWVLALAALVLCRLATFWKCQRALRKFSRRPSGPEAPAAPHPQLQPLRPRACRISSPSNTSSWKGAHQGQYRTRSDPTLPTCRSHREGRWTPPDLTGEQLSQSVVTTLKTRTVSRRDEESEESSLCSKSCARLCDGGASRGPASHPSLDRGAGSPAVMPSPDLQRSSSQSSLSDLDEEAEVVSTLLARLREAEHLPRSAAPGDGFRSGSLVETLLQVKEIVRCLQLGEQDPAGTSPLISSRGPW